MGTEFRGVGGTTTQGRATVGKQGHAGKGNTLARRHADVQRKPGTKAPPVEDKGNAIMIAVAYRGGREMDRWQGQANWEWGDLPVELAGKHVGGQWVWNHEQGEALCIASQSSETCGIEIEAWGNQRGATELVIVIGAHPDSEEGQDGEGDALDRSLAEMYSDLIPPEPRKQAADTSTPISGPAGAPDMGDMFRALLGDEAAAAGFGEQSEGAGRGQSGERAALGRGHDKGKRDGADDGSDRPSWYTLLGAAVNQAQGGRTPDEHSREWGSAGGQREGEGHLLGSGLWAGIIDVSAEVAVAVNAAIIISDAHFIGFSEKVLGKVVRGMGLKELRKELANDAERVIAARLREVKEKLDVLSDSSIARAQRQQILKSAGTEVADAYYRKARDHFARQASDTERLVARYADRPGDQAAHLRELARGNAEAYRKMERAAVENGGLEAKAAGDAAAWTRTADTAKDASKATGGVKWTPHGGKHVANRKVPWKKTVEATKSGPAKYKPGLDIEALERSVWAEGTDVTNGKAWKVMEFSDEVGASGGNSSRWVRVEESAGTIHGHPITYEEFKRLTR